MARHWPDARRPCQVGRLLIVGDVPLPLSGYPDRMDQAQNSERAATPKKWLRLIEDSQADPIEVLKTVGTYQRYLGAIEERAVQAARAVGRTWEEIAGAIGVSRQTAWEKFSSKGRDFRPARFSWPPSGIAHIQLRCAGCGERKVFRLERSSDGIRLQDEVTAAEFPLPGPVDWTCASCGSNHRSEVAAPPEPETA